MVLLGRRALPYNALMSNRAQELLREALTLSPDERADVAAELLASLDEPSENPAEVEAAWAAEIERRARRVLSGASAGEPWADVRNRIARRLRK
jgi:putative addiction module component (TIGR02574 family)